MFRQQQPTVTNNVQSATPFSYKLSQQSLSLENLPPALASQNSEYTLFERSQSPDKYLSFFNADDCLQRAAPPSKKLKPMGSLFPHQLQISTLTNPILLEAYRVSVRYNPALSWVNLVDTASAIFEQIEYLSLEELHGMINNGLGLDMLNPELVDAIGMFDAICIDRSRDPQEAFHLYTSQAAALPYFKEGLFIKLYSSAETLPVQVFHILLVAAILLGVTVRQRKDQTLSAYEAMEAKSIVVKNLVDMCVPKIVLFLLSADPIVAMPIREQQLFRETPMSEDALLGEFAVCNGLPIHLRGAVIPSLLSPSFSASEFDLKKFNSVSEPFQLVLLIANRLSHKSLSLREVQYYCRRDCQGFVEKAFVERKAKDGSSAVIIGQSVVNRAKQGATNNKVFRNDLMEMDIWEKFSRDLGK